AACRGVSHLFVSGSRIAALAGSERPGGRSGRAAQPDQRSRKSKRGIGCDPQFLPGRKRKTFRTIVPALSPGSADWTAVAFLFPGIRHQRHYLLRSADPGRSRLYAWGRPGRTGDDWYRERRIYHGRRIYRGPLGKKTLAFTGGLLRRIVPDCHRHTLQHENYPGSLDPAIDPVLHRGFRVFVRTGVLDRDRRNISNGHPRKSHVPGHPGPVDRNLSGGSDDPGAVGWDRSLGHLLAFCNPVFPHTLADLEIDSGNQREIIGGNRAVLENTVRFRTRMN